MLFNSLYYRMILSTDGDFAIEECPWKRAEEDNQGFLTSNFFTTKSEAEEKLGEVRRRIKLRPSKIPVGSKDFRL